METDFKAIGDGILRKAYTYIGTGSARTVYDLGNGTVVKAAKNKRGIAQNRAEHLISSADDSGLLAKTLAVSDDYRYLVMEKAQKADSLDDVLSHFGVSSTRQLFAMKMFRRLRRRYTLLLNDFRRPANWGVIGGKYVIVDYGFTEEVRRKYYRLF